MHPTNKFPTHPSTARHPPITRWAHHPSHHPPGKSTLLDLIAGVMQPASGVRELGETTHVGYFTQFVPPVGASLWQGGRGLAGRWKSTALA